MYTIYLDDQLLYAPDLANDGYVVLNPKCSFEVNKSGSLSFVLPPQNPLYGSIQKLRSIVTVFSDNEEIFRGRVLHDEKDFYNRKEIYSEGELSFFLDSIVRPYDFSGSPTQLFTKYVTEHNTQVEPAKQFTVGQVTVTDPNDYIVRASSDYPNTWSEMNDKLIKLMGGYIRTRKSGSTRYIDYIESYGHTNSQIIEFGINLLDIKEYISADDVFTVLIPLGKERITIAEVNDGKDYLVDEDAAELFGYVWKVNNWEDVTVPANLKTKGMAYLSEGIEMAVSLTLNAVDLHLLNVDTERISIGDTVRVVSIPHQIDKPFFCSKITLDLVQPDRSEYTFGYTFATMTEQSLNLSGSGVQSSVIEQIQTELTEASQTVQEVREAVITIPETYVSASAFESYKTEMSTALRWKGSVSTYNDLPVLNRSIGDVYNVLDTDANYVWTASGWDKLSETADLSGYVDLATFNALVSRVEALEGGGNNE